MTAIDGAVPAAPSPTCSTTTPSLPVWAVMVAEWTLRGIVFGWRFRSGAWERRRWVDAAG